MIDFFYGNESLVSSEGYVPYGWQLSDKKLVVYVERRHKINVCRLVSRYNQCHWATTQQNINAQFVMEQLDNLSLKIKKETFVVLDNASIHHAKLFQKILPIWQQRGLLIFFLPTCSPN